MNKEKLLVFASRQGMLPVVKLLLEQGANVNA
jgi:ankyrin repeat protein